MPTPLRRVLMLTAAPLAALIALAVLAPHPHSARGELALPPPPRPAWTVPRPVVLARPRDVSSWAPVREPVLARMSPHLGSRVVAVVALRTPEGTTNILELAGGARREGGLLWQHVRLAALPNGSTGWVPRSALGGIVVIDTRLVVDRAQFRATLWRDGTPIFSAPVGVGQGQWPTPPGVFYIRDVLTRFRSPAYGPIAFGTSARSPVLTDWPAGAFVGIHGTNEPRLIPGAISHGCIRMRNADILRLARVMPVGTPMIVR